MLYNQTMEGKMHKELASQQRDGLTISINWSPGETELCLCVEDAKSGTTQTANIAPDAWRDALAHPFRFLP